jgi:hypothetical protein
MAEEKLDLVSREQALRVARMLGCQGAHEAEKGWMPCGSHEEYEAIKKGKEEYLKVLASKKKKPLPKMVQRTKRLETKSDAYYENRADAVAISKARGCGGVRTVLLAGKKYYAVCNHKAPKRGWENLDEKPITGIATLPGGGLVSGSFSGKSLGRPIGGVAEFDGDNDGSLTGPDGQDTVPAPPTVTANNKNKFSKDISKELGIFLGKDVPEYLKSEGYKEIQKREGENQTGYFPDIRLEIIADKQGFSGLPKVVSSKEMAQLEKEGWTVAYRGIANTKTQKTTLSAKDLAKQFKTGRYYGGYGTYGNGTYFATDIETAKDYAGEDGEIIKVAIPPNVLMERKEFKNEVIKHQDSFNGNKPRAFYGDDDIGRVLAAKGVRGVRMNLIISGSFVAEVGEAIETNVILVWDRSMLVVEEGSK